MYAIDIAPFSPAVNDVVVRPATPDDAGAPLYADLGDAVRDAMRLGGFLRVISNEGKVERPKMMSRQDWATLKILLDGDEFKSIYIKPSVPLLSGNLIEVQQVFRLGTIHGDKPEYYGTFFRFESKEKDGFRAPLWQYFVYVHSDWRLLHRPYTMELQRDVAALLGETSVSIVRFTVLNDGSGAARFLTETRHFPV